MFDSGRFAQDMAAFWETACGLPDIVDGTADDGAFADEAGGEGKPQIFYQRAEPEAYEKRGYTETANTSEAEQAVKNSIQDALGKASDKTYTDTHKLMPVADWAVKAAADHGLDIAGFEHAIDGSAINHVIFRSGRD